MLEIIVYTFLGMLILVIIGIYLECGFIKDSSPTKPETLITDRPTGSEVILNGERVDLLNMK